MKIPRSPASERWHRIAGLAGVASHERPLARKWGEIFEWPMLAVVTWIPIQWFLEETGLLPAVVYDVANWIVWLFFVVETTVLTTLVKHKWRHLLYNWMNVAIILVGIPILWLDEPFIGLLRSLRLLLLLGLLFRLSHFWRVVMHRNQLGVTLVISFFIVMISGLLIAYLDPNIETPWDGIWWAWVTVTTVGYGDVVPTSAPGRLFGSLLILLGIGLFSILTANISAFLVGRDAAREEREMRHRLKDIQERLERLEQRLGEKGEGES